MAQQERFISNVPATDDIQAMPMKSEAANLSKGFVPVDIQRVYDQTTVDSTSPREGFSIYQSTGPFNAVPGGDNMPQDWLNG